MTVVGDKQLLLTQTLLLADDELGRFDVPVGDETLPVSVRFTSPSARESTLRWESQKNGKALALEFIGWKSSVGSGMAKPKRVADVNGSPVGFNMAHQRVGTLNVVTFQFYLGGTYE